MQIIISEGYIMPYTLFTYILMNVTKCAYWDLHNNECDYMQISTQCSNIFLRCYIYPRCLWRQWFISLQTNNKIGSKMSLSTCHIQNNVHKYIWKITNIPYILRYQLLFQFKNIHPLVLNTKKLSQNLLLSFVHEQLHT